jgi:hypothetical protein
MIQVPHHGSRRNVSPSVLNRIVGPRQVRGTPATKWAVVSAPKDDENHPRKSSYLAPGDSIPRTILGAMAFDLVAIAGWLLFVREPWVRESGDQYARALLATCDAPALQKTTST